MKVLLIGKGQIGTAVKKAEEIAGNEVDVIERDYAPKEKKQEYPICHVCIPYSDNFENTIEEYLLKYKPELTIIHSTVTPGTTENLVLKTDMKIVHSPVMGVHPNLLSGVLTFKKIIGSNDPEAMELAAQHFKSLDIDTVPYDSATNSETAKLFSTSYYGWVIAYMKEVHRFCKENDLNFDQVYKKTNEIYNEGYAKLDKKNVIRPVLEFMPGPTGGHCITNNYKILKDLFPLSKIFLELDNGFDEMD